MEFFCGLDIGGTKIAGAVFDEQNKELAQVVHPTPTTYEAYIELCTRIVTELKAKAGGKMSVGIGAPFAVANMPFLVDKPVKHDLEKSLGQEIRLANDANCAALAEAVDGAGLSANYMLGLIMGTGVAGGLILNKKIIEGVNGLTGELGHVALPYYEPSDGPLYPCNCGQKGCLEKLVAGGALARLYEMMTSKKAEAKEITELAHAKDADALKVLDRFYTVVAKAMVVIIHCFDPEIITVSGGLNDLPGLYDEVPKRWGKYLLVKNPKTKFVQAAHGSMAGLRGAAWLWRS